jgi:DNA-binding NtrC family response regulator
MDIYLRKRVAMEEKILLVDDEEGIRKVLGISLMDIGYQVITAENGRDGPGGLSGSTHRPSFSPISRCPSWTASTCFKQIKAESPDTEVIHAHRPRGHGSGHQVP